MSGHLNVPLHNKRPYKLGIVKIAGSCKAEKTQELVERKLSKFGLKFKDIVASTHDGAVVMQKYGRLILAESQFCFNHGIHLSVTDVFYVKKRKNTKAQTSEDGIADYGADYCEGNESDAATDQQKLQFWR
jgi:hypothetical protein